MSTMMPNNPTGNTDATPTTSNSSNANQSGASRNNKRYYKRNDSSAVGSKSKTYQGKTPELNAVLGLMSERLDYGMTS